MKKTLISIFIIALLIGVVIPVSSDISLEKNSFQIEVNKDDYFDLIIITNAYLISELEPLVQHKNQHGVYRLGSKISKIF